MDHVLHSKRSHFTAVARRRERMLNRRTVFTSISVASALAIAVSLGASRPALAAGDCGGGWVDNVSSNQENIGCAGEDSNLSGSQNFGNCYGQCGKACSWYNCGGGGCCQTHDYYTRTQGMWSGAATSYFPSGVVPW